MEDLRAQSHRQLFLSDTSEELTASIKVDIRGAWCKLLTPWQSLLKTRGKLREEDGSSASQPSFLAGTG